MYYNQLVLQCCVRVDCNTCCCIKYVHSMDNFKFKQWFEVVIALALKVHVFEQVTVCCWVSGSLHFEGL